MFGLRGVDVDVDLQPRRPRSVPNFTAEGVDPISEVASQGCGAGYRSGREADWDRRTKRTPPRATGMTSGPHG